MRPPEPGPPPVLDTAEPLARASEPRLKAITCPACGGAIGSLAPGGIDECPYCDAPVMLVAPGVSGAAAIEPSVSYERARSIVERFLSTPGTPPRLKESAARRGIELTFAPWFDLLLVQASEERAPLRSRIGVTRLTASALADDGREIGCDRIPADRLRAAAAPVRPVELASRAIVLDPQRPPESIDLPKVAGDPVTIERRVRVVFYPIWLARFSHGRSLYQCAVDGVTGEILRGVAPSYMRRRVIAGVAFTFLFSVLLTLLLRQPSVVLHLAARTPQGSLAVLGGAVLLLGAAWDRLRFRRELIVEGDRARQVPINRPKQTALEALGRGMISAAKRRGGSFEWRWGS